MNHRFASCITFAAFGLALANCSESATPDTTSTFQGALAIDTFPARPESVQATNELGVVAQAPVSAAGDFRIELSRDHSYALAVSWGTEHVNVVFPRATGRLTSRFDVSSGAALVSLGTVRYLAAAPAGGFFLKSAQAQVDSSATAKAASGQAEGADGELGECVNGMILGSGAVCVDDDGVVACEGEQSDGDGECKNGVDSTTGLACSDPPEASNGDGECENGKDTSTGLACTDPADGSDGDGECENGVDASTGLACTDPEDNVDPTQPMAVAEHNVPDQVGGCNEGGEEKAD